MEHMWSMLHLITLFCSFTFCEYMEYKTVNFSRPCFQAKGCFIITVKREYCTIHCKILFWIPKLQDIANKISYNLILQFLYVKHFKEERLRRKVWRTLIHLKGTFWWIIDNRDDSLWFLSQASAACTNTDVWNKLSKIKPKNCSHTLDILRKTFSIFI